MNIYEYLDKLFSNFLTDEKYLALKKHAGVILLASERKIAICGSLAISIITKNPSKVPSDIDLVTDTNEKAISFLSEILQKIEKYKWYGKIQVQNQTNFCFDGTLCHYKLTTSFGFNICVMVLKSELKLWYTKEGLCVQFIEDLKKYVELSSKKDGKQRDEIPLEEIPFN